MFINIRNMCDDNNLQKEYVRPETHEKALKLQLPAIEFDDLIPSNGDEDGNYVDFVYDYFYEPEEFDGMFRIRMWLNYPEKHIHFTIGTADIYPDGRFYAEFSLDLLNYSGEDEVQKERTEAAIRVLDRRIMRQIALGTQAAVLGKIDWFEDFEWCKEKGADPYSSNMK